MKEPTFAESESGAVPEMKDLFWDGDVAGTIDFDSSATQAIPAVIKGNFRVATAWSFPPGAEAPTFEGVLAKVGPCKL